jgi:hypothetical protein
MTLFGPTLYTSIRSVNAFSAFCTNHFFASHVCAAVGMADVTDDLYEMIEDNFLFFAVTLNIKDDEIKANNPFVRTTCLHSDRLSMHTLEALKSLY